MTEIRYYFTCKRARDSALCKCNAGKHTALLHTNISGYCYILLCVDKRPKKLTACFEGYLSALHIVGTSGIGEEKIEKNGF